MEKSYFKNWTTFVTAGITCIGLTCGSVAYPQQQKYTSQESDSLGQRETVTDNWFGKGHKLEERGISLGLGVTEIYQNNLRDGKDSGAGGQSGSYDLELELDLQKLVGFKGASVFLLGEGSWSGGSGVDASALGGSLFGINDDFGGERTLDITELWYQQALMDGNFKFRVGKLDLTAGFEVGEHVAAFDGNQFANDETAQFLNGALVNNASIPFPDNGLGAMAILVLNQWSYVSAGIADAEGDARTTGFGSAFDGDHDYFYITEIGFMPQLQSDNGPLPGTYRVGAWHDRQPKTEFVGGDTEYHDTGFYLSFDQKIYRKNLEDNQGLGIFGRAGWADEDVNEVDVFVSGGMQYQGLIAGRDSDVLGIGAAYGGTSNDAGLTANYENVVEIYYNAELTPWLHLAPDIQWVSNPGGAESGGDALICGLRAQINF